jgi:peroxiredoxin Q/BCP
MLSPEFFTEGVMHRLRRIKTVAGIVLILTTAACVRAASRPAAGTAGPNFTLSTQDGKQASLTDYRGKWLVLYFYPANFTRMGNLEAEMFQRDMAEYARSNAVVLGICTEDPPANKAFAAKKQLTFTLLSDHGARVADEYGSTTSFHMSTLAARNTFLIDPTGRIAQVFLNVDPEHHSADVLKALATLQHR